MKIKALLSIAGLGCMFISIHAYSQLNLVPTPSFGKLDGKVKKEGQIQLADGWSSPTEKQADIYSEESKNELFKIPDNGYGTQESKEDYNYAGILFFSYKNKEPRSYLQAKLLQPLLPEKTYCIKFNVSLADASKYACNNIGLYISGNKLSGKDILSYELPPQIKHDKNKIFDNQDTWVTVCGLYEATGNEQYITIGNFASNESTEIQKLKRPSGIKIPQKDNAYFYIEDVSVIPMDSLPECVCEQHEGIQNMKVIYHEDISEGNAFENEKLIQMKKSFFEYNSDKIAQNSINELDKLILILIDNQTIRLEIVGHTDNQEKLKSESSLSEQRAKVVYDYLVSKGINSKRLSYKGLGSDQPSSQEATLEGRAQNRRVEFVIIK